MTGAAGRGEVLGIPLVADSEGVHAGGNLIARNGAHLAHIDDADGPGASGGHVDRAGGSRARGCSGLDDLGAHDDRFSGIRALLDRRDDRGGSLVDVGIVRSACSAGVSTVARDRSADREVAGVGRRNADGAGERPGGNAAGQGDWILGGANGHHGWQAARRAGESTHRVGRHDERHEGADGNRRRLQVEQGRGCRDLHGEYGAGDSGR